MAADSLEVHLDGSTSLTGKVRFPHPHIAVGCTAVTSIRDAHGKKVFDSVEYAASKFPTEGRLSVQAILTGARIWGAEVQRLIDKGVLKAEEETPDGTPMAVLHIVTTVGGEPMVLTSEFVVHRNQIRSRGPKTLKTPAAEGGAMLSALGECLYLRPEEDVDELTMREVDHLKRMHADMARGQEADGIRDLALGYMLHLGEVHARRAMQGLESAKVAGPYSVHTLAADGAGWQHGPELCEERVLGSVA
jgi:hypothetical protein